MDAIRKEMDAVRVAFEILNDNEKVLRQDLYAYARLINLLIHYELGNFDLIEYLIKSTQRFLNKKNRDFEVEKLIITNIRKLSKSSSKEKTLEIFHDFRNKLERNRFILPLPVVGVGIPV